MALGRIARIKAQRGAVDEANAVLARSRDGFRQLQQEDAARQAEALLQQVEQLAAQAAGA